ncbi:MAG TPA: hypothetical protein PKO09_15165 [Anaerolineae bacterium]|nr:hypothetical protein [Anaerolineae bacterium]
MKTALIALGVIVLALALVAGGMLLGGTFLRGRAASPAACPLAAGGLPDGPGWGFRGNQAGAFCGGGLLGRGMMGGRYQGMPCAGSYAPPRSGDVLSLEEAGAAAEGYLDRAGYTGLEIEEVMEFQYNHYVLVRESDTGIGAMELLVDPSTGVVSQEMGPNRMWNAKYGMMGQGGRRGMMRGYSASGEMTLSAEQAGESAQRWLDENLPGRTAGEADAFYGYYTFHFLKDGAIDGMLSVHGSSGDVWYHSWHGAFVRMAEETGL